jgi:hypothetical protein
MTLARFSDGRLLAPCSVSIQHCSAALDWVSGGGAASAVGVSVWLVLQLARITAANSRRPKGATLVRATVQGFIANVDPKYWRQTTLAIFGVTRKLRWASPRRFPPPWTVEELDGITTKSLALSSSFRHRVSLLFQSRA